MKRILSVLIAMAALVCLLVSCSTPEEGGDSFVGSSDAVKIAKDDFESYTFVRPIRMSPEDEDVLIAFGTSLSEVFGFFEMKEDRLTEEGELEILFGETNREASTALIAEKKLLYGDFTIAYEDGKVLLIAGSAEAYADAVSFFLENCMDDDGNLWIPYSYEHRVNYPLKSITVDGNDLFEYSVVAASFYSDVANDFVLTLRDLTGVTLERSTSSKYKHIYIGKAPSGMMASQYFAQVRVTDNGDIYIYGAALEKTLDLFFYRMLGYDGITTDTVKETVAVKNAGYEESDYTALLAVRKAHYELVDLYLDASYTGTERNGGADTPFTSFDEAFAAIRARVAEKNYLNVTLHVAEGTYVEADAAVLDMTDETNSYFLTVVGDGKDKVTVTSNGEIAGSDFERVNSSPIYVYHLPASYKRDGAYPAYRDLALNGVPLRVARSAGEYEMQHDIGFGHSLSQYEDDEEAVKEYLRSLPDEERVLYLDADLLDSLGTPDDLHGAELWIRVEWQIHCLRIEGYDPGGVITSRGRLYPVLINSKDWSDFIGNYHGSLQGRSYWLENVECLIDEPGEFCVNGDALYVYPPSGTDISAATISLPTAEQLLVFKNVQNVALSGMSFTGTANTYLGKAAYVTGQCGYLKKGDGFLPYAAVYGENVTDVSVTDCAFYDLGYDGISFRGIVTNATVSGCEFNDMAASAIRFGQNKTYGKKHQNNGVIITENYITNTGTTFASSPGIYVSGVDGLSISHNTIKNTSYSAISVGWSWSKMTKADGINVRNAEIAYNYIENFMTNMKDGGAIYVVGGNAPQIDTRYTPEYFNSCHHNYCVVGKETGSFLGALSGGWTVLYHDGASSNWETTDNVIYSAHDTEKVCNPTRFTYISYQSIEAQQAYDCFGDRNYVVNISDRMLIYGVGYRGGTDVLLYSHEHGLDGGRNDVMLKNNAALLECEEAMAIVNGAGCEGHTGVVPTDY